MFSFLRRKPRPVEVHRQPTVEFVHEQDGPIERRFKQSLEDDLGSAGVQRAYLVRVSYGKPDSYEVALCLVAREDPAIAAKVGAAFARLFGKDIHLDIKFPSAEQEARLATVCSPFFASKQRAG
jgi:hypothetical protein